MRRIQHLGSWIWERLRAAHRTKVSRQSGFALLVVTVTLAMLGAVVGEFSYNARVELEAANNARDQMRAEYLARSSVNLSRLLIKVQQSVIDKLPPPVNTMFSISDIGPYLVKAFGGDKDEREGIGSLLGIEAGSIKGLGVGDGASFDVELASEDGKINVNCGGGLNPDAMDPPAQATAGANPNGRPPRLAPRRLFWMLGGLMAPQRYDRMFQDADSDGQYWQREDVARAIVDWSDLNESRFEATGPSTAAEDYRYDARKEPYKAHNHFYDTIDELHMVRGVGDKWYGNFGQMLTVYGSCKVNLRALDPKHWQIVAALIRACPANPSDPRVTDEKLLAQEAQSRLAAAKAMGVPNVDALATGMAGMLQNLAGSLGINTGGAASPTGGAQGGPAPPALFDVACLKDYAKAEPRKVYRVDATGTVTRPGGRSVQVKISAVWDTRRFNQNDISPNADRSGVWAYWRME